MAQAAAANLHRRKILQHKRHFEASHWDPDILTLFIYILTYFNWYFDEDIELSSSKYLLKYVKI